MSFFCSRMLRVSLDSSWLWHVPRLPVCRSCQCWDRTAIQLGFIWWFSCGWTGVTDRGEDWCTGLFPSYPNMSTHWQHGLALGANLVSWLEVVFIRCCLRHNNNFLAVTSTIRVMMSRGCVSAETFSYIENFKISTWFAFLNFLVAGWRLLKTESLLYTMTL